jgi:hypothetical protein
MDQLEDRLESDRAECVSWTDRLVMLLHVGAEIEHGLMLQYLYAGWSIDVDGAPPEWRARLLRWQDSILAVAKEEMGHLVTVQNLLALLGAPPNLGRSDFPWDIDHYPFPFCLEPLSPTSVALYLFSEKPTDEELRACPRKGRRARHYAWFEAEGRVLMERLIATRVVDGRPLHRVDALYREIVDLIGDTGRIPDSAFREDAYRGQARWDDWGRRYRPPPQTLTPGGALAGEAPVASANTNVLVAPVATRQQAVAALCELSEQGEGPHLGGESDAEPSHFDRFLEIFHDLAMLPDTVHPALPAATNPTTRKDGGAGAITHPRTRLWAGLANLRYRMLLTFLAHALRAAPAAARDEANLRGSLVHRTFGEMYAIKALSARLMRLPMHEEDDGTRAGPPFAVPYDIALPADERDTWRLHLKLVRGALDLGDDLLKDAPADEAAQLRSMRDLDRGAEAWITRILEGLDPRGGAA